MQQLRRGARPERGLVAGDDGVDDLAGAIDHFLAEGYERIAYLDLDAHHGEYTDARAHLDDARNLLENCADIYTRCDDVNRRLCNQAFFTKVYIEEDGNLRVENNRPFEMLLDPEVNANALNWAQNADKARTQPNDSSAKGASLVRGVGPVGLEPTTYGLKVRSSAN